MQTRLLTCCLHVVVLQVFDVETTDMLLEIKTNRLGTVQYCHACPTSNLLAIAFSNYTVEVERFSPEYVVLFYFKRVKRHIVYVSV